jgi:hypothetical protein
MGNRLHHSMLVCRYSLETGAYLEASMLTITTLLQDLSAQEFAHWTIAPIAIRPVSAGMFRDPTNATSAGPRDLSTQLDTQHDETGLLDEDVEIGK